MKSSRQEMRLHIQVSAHGKAAGSERRPYATLEAARNALRRLRRQGKLTGPVQVLVAPGVYRGWTQGAINGVPCWHARGQGG